MPVAEADEILLLIGRPAIELFKSKGSTEPTDIAVLKNFRKILEEK